MIVLRADGAALMQHRDDKPGLRHAGKWTPPGGHAEPGEAMIDCAMRELHEETGYATEDLHYLLSVEDTPDDAGPYWLDVYWCWYDGTQPLTCNEGQDLKFIERSSAGQYSIPAVLVSAWDAARSAASMQPRTVKP